jgi:Cytochrome C oxidase, cbb3-type, subunit III
MATASRIPQQVRLMHRSPGGAQDASRIPSSAIDPDHNLRTRSESGMVWRHGRALAERMCSACHAVGRRGKSPHVGAPPFRALDRRVDLDTFTDRLREGLMVDHPDMPTFRFTREDARAFLLYLRSIQTP